MDFELRLRNNEDDIGLGGFVDDIFTEEVNVLVGTDTLNQECFDKYGDILIYVIKHEIFHVLMNQIKKMDDYDSYLTYAQVGLMYKDTCLMYKKQEILNEENILPIDDTYMFVKKSISKLNEALRNRYSNDLIIGESGNLFFEVIGSYRGEMFKGQEFWKSDLLRVDLEQDDEYYALSGEDKIVLGKKSMDWLSDHVKDIYDTQSSSMTNLERFVSKELIDRSKNGSLFSEVSSYQSGMVPSEFANRYLPGLLMYSSIMRGDWKFVNAVSKDVDLKVAEGILSENKRAYILRKLGYFINIIKESNGDGGCVGQNVEEYMADQFALCLTDELGYDLNNLKSSLKSRSIINKLRPQIKNLLDFFKERNLARIGETVV